MSYEDETLMAYADGELDDALRAEIAAAIEQDPQLARRVEQHRALRAEVSGAYANVLDRPLPDRLRAAALGSTLGSALGSTSDSTPGPVRDRAEARGNVVQFPTRNARAPALRWGAREWVAMAASLLLGVLISWRTLAPREDLLQATDGALVARGALAEALDQQLASAQPRDAAVHIGVTFKTREGGYCRSFTLPATNTAGLACHAGGDWRIPATTSVEAGGQMQQAAGAPPAILQAIEARIAGEPLDAAGEEAARGAGWSR